MAVEQVFDQSDIVTDNEFNKLEEKLKAKNAEDKGEDGK